jgi:uncharacterized protein (DUF4415 family)
MSRNREEKWVEARRRALADIARTSDEEDARITAAALADPDAQPLTEEMWAKAMTSEEAEKRRRGQRGRQKAPTKQLVSLRIDRDVLAYFRKTGPGWQARINAALRKVAGLR